MKKCNRILAALTFLLACLPSHAALFDRGGGLIYDDSLNITWSQDAFWGQIGGYGTGGYATQTFNINYLGYQDWRLPTLSEMQHLFYSDFNGTLGQTPRDFSPFINVQLGPYWGEPYGINPSEYSWTFQFYNGGVNSTWNRFSAAVWPVRNGDVSAVPLPATAWLFGSALIGLTGIKRNKYRKD